MHEDADSAGERADFVFISGEFAGVVAPAARETPLGVRPVALIVALTPEVCTLRVEPRPEVETLAASAGPQRMILFVPREALFRLGGRALVEGAGAFHLDRELRAIALRLRDAPGGDRTAAAYRQAKALEFLCEAIRLSRAGELSPLGAAGPVSATDTRRLLIARQFIHERAEERLTLDRIARASGLSRSKLTRGFKDLFNSTVAQEIARRRLELARTMLLTTDLSIALVGVRAGYLNNASFSRAFGRHFGRSPSFFRQGELAA